jgi:hypothetical protein
MTERSGSESASPSVRDFLEAFDGLEECDRRERVVEILRHARELEWPPGDEETIHRIADESFREYDLREAD